MPDKKNIWFPRSATVQAALSGASDVLRTSPHVREGYRWGIREPVVADVIRLSLKALVIFQDWLTETHPEWEKASAGEAEPEQKQINIRNTEEIARLLELAKGKFIRRGREHFLYDDDMITLALTVIALYGRELNEKFPHWQEEEVS